MINLKELRETKEYSKSQLSELSGVSVSYISEIEAGKYHPTDDIICKLCKALNCMPNDLVKCD
jgi:transcriptional regulator with XRE-family HTH domain